MSGGLVGVDGGGIPGGSPLGGPPGGLPPGGTALSGAVAGIYTVTFRVTRPSPTSSVLNVVTRAVNFYVGEITTASLPAGDEDVPYFETLAGTGFDPDSLWTVSIGALPSGMTLNPTTGVIGGTPTDSGSSVFTIKRGVCEKQFSLTINPAIVPSCGWWNGITYVKDPSPHCSPTTTPDDLTDATEIHMSVPATQPDMGCYLRLDGTKTYTGAPLIIKLVANITALGPDFGGGVVLLSVGALISDFIAAVGTYTYDAEVPESLADDYAIHFEGVNGVEATFTMTSCESTVGATDDWELVPGNPLFYYTPVGVSPSATITIASNRPITWDIHNSFNKAYWISPPTVTLDGVPIGFTEDGINWYLDIGTVETDACIEKVFVISGPTVADPTGVGQFYPVPQV